jgi:DNA-binding HxlR family transcriptional regulator
MAGDVAGRNSVVSTGRGTASAADPDTGTISAAGRDAEPVVARATVPRSTAPDHAVTCRIREILERIGDKWSLQVIFQLSQGPQRFTRLKRGIEGISQRMLTVTLRGLERDGIVSRTMYPVIPPRVEYELTPLGRSLSDAVGALVAWADAHLAEVDLARAAYDARMPRGDQRG